MRNIKLFAFITLLLPMVMVSPQKISHIPARQTYFHIVEETDTWGKISAQYSVPLDAILKANGVIQPTLIQSGLRIFIPGSDGTAQNDVLAITTDEANTPLRFALITGNPYYVLLTLNSHLTISTMYGQAIYAPDRSGEVLVVEVPQESTTPNPPTIPPSPTEIIVIPDTLLDSNRMGIQGHFIVSQDDANVLLDQTAYDLGMGWVKQQVDWSRIEYLPGQYSVELESLDMFVQAANARRLNIMLSIVKAPDWARATTDSDGPPVNYEDYYQFVSFIINRYKPLIKAVEIWNEPNLGREWVGGTLSGYEYVNLLAGAYTRVKATDPGITVISAGLAPTGISDGVNAIDDRTYLRQMYEAELPAHTDVIGIHPYGWGNPPWLRCCGSPDGPPTHNDHPSFFFLDTIEYYRVIQAEFGDSDRQLWATEFGWGTMDGLGLDAPAEQPFFAYLNEGLQADYILSAYYMAQDMDYMGPMILWNLNVATLDGFDHNQAGYSILRNTGRRQAFDRIANEPKSVR